MVRTKCLSSLKENNVEYIYAYSVCCQLKEDDKRLISGLSFGKFDGTCKFVFI